jgi:hypothetical protein
MHFLGYITRCGTIRPSAEMISIRRRCPLVWLLGHLRPDDIGYYEEDDGLPRQLCVLSIVRRQARD